MRVPDHGMLSPWRFVTVAEEHRDDLAALLRRALAEEDPDANPAVHEKAEQFAHYAGQMIVLISRRSLGHKIPVWEQQLSCGAAG